MIQILTGEPLQRGRALEELKLRLLQGGPKEFNLDQFEGREVTATRLLETCRLFPVLSTARLVIVTEADRIPKGEMDKIEGSLPELSRLCELILVAEKIDRRLKFWQKAAETGKFIEFKTPRDFPRAISGECRRLNISIGPEAVEWLSLKFGADWSLLVSQLEKVSYSVGPQGKIGLADLEAAGGNYPWKNIFELTDAVGRRDLSRALNLFRKMTSGGESPVGMVALLARHFRLLLTVKETGGGVPPFFLANYQEQAKRFDMTVLQKGMEGIFQADRALKSSPLPSKLLMEGLIRDLCLGGEGLDE